MEQNKRNLFDVFELLEPMLAGNDNLQAHIRALAKLIGQQVRLRGLILLRCDHEWGYIESGVWLACQETTALPQHLAEGLLERLKTDRLQDNTAENLLGRTGWVVFPAFCNQLFTGFALYLREKETTAQDGQERQALERFTEFLATLFANRTRFEKQRLHSFVFNSMMDNMKAALYITDVDTDRILYMNKTMKETFQLEHPEGKICWQVLQKEMTKRCTFCPLDKLKNDNETALYVWEEVNTVTGRIYENYDSLIRWVNGSIVHMQQSIDVTDTRMISRVARIDELTEMLNRRAGKQALADSVEKAKQQGVMLTVGLYDINLLKQVNDNYGHTAGDRMIATIAKTVQRNLTKQSYPFRLSGDEFVVVFYDTGIGEANERMQNILKELSEQKSQLEIPYDLSFCYGLLEIGPQTDYSVEDILIHADEKMYEQKRRYHILVKERERTRLLSQQESAQRKHFTYNKDKLYDALIQSTDDYIYICNMKTGVFRYPRAMVEEFDLPGEVIANAAAIWGEKVHPNDKKAFLESNQEITDGRTDIHCVEYRAINRRGEWVWLRCRGHLERDENGEPVLFAGFITNLGQKNLIDHLTGLFNRIAFEDKVRTLLKDRPEHSLGLMVLGIDNFKHINGLYNRQFGDEVIRIVSQKIQTMLPGNASIYRLYGDEFSVIFTDADRELMQRSYDWICNDFRHQQQFDGKTFFCTLSGGCALYPADADNYLDLFQYANYSLEYAKSEGKNRLCFYEKEISSEQKRSMELLELLRESVENRFKGFQLYYQPVVYADSGKLMGAEALARWNCAKYGEVSPAEFIPVLEQSGLIVPVGRWVLEQAAMQCAVWSEIDPEFVMSVNLSYLQILEPDFARSVHKILEQYGVNPQNMILELTESCLVEESETVKDFYRDVRAYGVKVAMDDFGTGYSSLGILKSCPADILKIDKMFIQNIESSRFDKTFIRYTVELCHDVGMKICLEGVETEEVYQIVKPLGLDYIQGFLFGKPLPSQQFHGEFVEGILEK